jgi:hypothetical protein
LRHIAFVLIPAVKGLKDDFEPAVFHDNGRAFNEFASINPNAPNQSTNVGESAMNEEQFRQIIEKLDQILNVTANKVPNQPNGVPPNAPQMQGGAPYNGGMQPMYGAPMFSDPATQALWNQFLIANGKAPVTNGNGNNSGNSEVEALRAQLAEANRNATKAEFSEFMKTPEVASRVPVHMRDTYIDFLCQAKDKDDAARKNGMQFGEANPSAVDAFKAKIMQISPNVDLSNSDFAERGASTGANETREKQRSEIAKRMAQHTKGA